MGAAVSNVKSVRAKAGLPWPESGTYICDKCHARQAGQAGAIATRCTALRGPRQQSCNCAYFVLDVRPGSVDGFVAS
jgi:hypothetical protein